RVRRDRADYFATRPEGLTARHAVEWGLVDEAVPRPLWNETVAARADEFARRTELPNGRRGIALTELEKARSDTEVSYRYVTAALDRDRGCVDITVRGPDR